LSDSICDGSEDEDVSFPATNAALLSVLILFIFFVFQTRLRREELARDA
jgi:hypothetical protein